jgi:ribonuclease VapC
MTMFVDASVIVAILTGEETAQSLSKALDGRQGCITSHIAVWEAAASISRKTGRPASGELRQVLLFLDLAEIAIVAADTGTLEMAVAAFDRYGRRSGHLANLNLGDCFAYAFAKQKNLPLLFIGKDFTFTDVNG